jgi:DNA-directed RNA polymerase specialized sigma24 family protein
MHDRLAVLHRRLLDGDRTASEAVARLALEPLFERVRPSYPRIDEHAVMTGVVDAVLEYCAAPEKVSPEDGQHLMNHLARAAWRNLANLVRGQKRRRTREECYGDRATREAVEQSDPLGILLQREEEAERQKRIESLMKLLPDPDDRTILSLRLKGERAVEVFAKALGLSHLPVEEQRKAVKRAKDRVDKVIRRSKEVGS